MEDGLIAPLDTASTWSCLLVSCMLQQYSRLWLTTYYVIRRIFLCTCTWMTFWFFSPDLQSGQRHVYQVLQCLLQHNLFVKEEKCEFHTSTVSFLVTWFQKEKWRWTQKCSKQSENGPSLNHVNRYNDFWDSILFYANLHRKFIWNFSSIAAPLHLLTSQKNIILDSPGWGSLHQAKRLFYHSPFSEDPRTSVHRRSWCLWCWGGIILSQRRPMNGKLHPCAFLCQKLTQAERNYNFGNQELLAVKVALEEWWHWL